MTLAWMHLKIYDLEDPPNRSGVEVQAAGKIAQGEEASGKLGRLGGGEAPACHNLEPQKEKEKTIKAVEHEHYCLLTKMRATHIAPVGKDPDQRVANFMCLCIRCGCTWASEPDGHACANKIQLG
jgi:hypothetical protein